MAHYDKQDSSGNPLVRALPKVPGINAQPMTRNAGIGHTPWRTSATVTPKTKGVNSAKPTSGRHQPRTHQGNPRKRKPRGKAPISGATLHAQWARGTLY